MVVSHPIQHYAPMYREIAALGEVDLRVFFAWRWGVDSYHDPEFGRAVQWDVPLTEGYEHEFLPIRRPPTQISFWQVDNPEVRSALARFDPNVVSVHGYAQRTLWRAIGWAGDRRRPVLLYGDSSVSTRTSWPRRALKRLVVTEIYRQLDGAMAVGDRNRDYHLRYGMPVERLFPGALPVDAKRILAAVPDGAAARLEIRRRFGISPEAFVVIFAGKYVPWKRPLDLSRAVSLLAGRGRDVVALFAGDGPLAPEIEAAGRAIGENRIVLAGFVNQAEIPRLYVAADVLAVPSERDSHPLAVSEAATLGIPAILSERCGCIGENDVARPGETALVHECGDVEGLAAAIERLASDRALLRRLGSRAREVAATQDVHPAAQLFTDAARKLAEMGKR